MHDKTTVYIKAVESSHSSGLPTYILLDESIAAAIVNYNDKASQQAMNSELVGLGITVANWAIAGALLFVSAPVSLTAATLGIFSWAPWAFRRRA